MFTYAKVRKRNEKNKFLTLWKEGFLIMGFIDCHDPNI
jgi:hypothetical protein